MQLNRVFSCIQGFIDENDTEPALFGDYEFTGSDSLQYFPVKVSYAFNTDILLLREARKFAHGRNPG